MLVGILWGGGVLPSGISRDRGRGQLILVGNVCRRRRGRRGRRGVAGGDVVGGVVGGDVVVVVVWRCR